MNLGLLFTNPQILNLLISFVQGDDEMWKGYLYVAVLTVVSFLIGKPKFSKIVIYFIIRKTSSVKRHLQQNIWMVLDIGSP